VRYARWDLSTLDLVDPSQSLQTVYGLKFNPLLSESPQEALLATPAVDAFCRPVEFALADGGFALITGDPGTGKSIALSVLAARLRGMRDVVVGSVEHPQSGVLDFYRELADVFGIAMPMHNRWAGFKALRGPSAAPPTNHPRTDHARRCHRRRSAHPSRSATNQLADIALRVLQRARRGPRGGDSHERASRYGRIKRSTREARACSSRRSMTAPRCARHIRRASRATSRPSLLRYLRHQLRFSRRLDAELLPVDQLWVNCLSSRSCLNPAPAPGNEQAKARER
jgi:hypothetical protein